MDPSGGSNRALALYRGMTTDFLSDVGARVTRNKIHREIERRQFTGAG